MPYDAFCQSNESQSNELRDSLLFQWLTDLYAVEASMVKDSVLITEETLRLIEDEEYRLQIYPETYTWGVTLGLIKREELKKAFWYMINLYMVNDQNKNLVVKAMAAYDYVFKMDKILVSTFYTYCFMDPEIGTIVNGKPEITAPHILEKKLDAVNEILFYLEEYKSRRKDH